ncbi:MAG: phosphate ABC transporter ATP-binding protein, partial [Candidatus Limnocylindrales bacterium]
MITVRPGTPPSLQPLPGATSATPQRPPEPAEPVIRLDGVSCWYGSFRAVRDVDLAIEPRKVTALIGPSGCGK